MHCRRQCSSTPLAVGTATKEILIFGSATSCSDYRGYRTSSDVFEPPQETPAAAFATEDSERCTSGLNSMCGEPGSKSLVPQGRLSVAVPEVYHELEPAGTVLPYD
jgi:hypothetical protein